MPLSAIVHMQVPPPLYVQVHVDPVHIADQTLPLPSSQVDVLTSTPFCRPPFVEQDAAYADRGMPGH
jgi:hypothetical protein